MGYPMAKFAFVIHPLSFEDVVRYEPGRRRQRPAPIIEKIIEWMPAYAAAHITGVRTPDGRETEGWFVAAPLHAGPDAELAARTGVRRRSPGRSRSAPSSGPQIAGLGAFTGVVGDAGVTLAERSPIPVTTGNSLTISAGVQSLLRGAREMEIDTPHATPS